MIAGKSKISASVLDGLVRTHLVDGGALRADDFDAHFQARKEALTSLIEKAMGKAAQRDAAADDPAGLADQFEDDAEVVAEENAEGAANDELAD